VTKNKQLQTEPTFFQGDKSKPMLIDPDGRPMSLDAWSDAFENYEGRVLARDAVGDREVRTLWHGITDGDFLVGWSHNTGIFGSTICARAPEGSPREFIPDLSTASNGKWGREITTSTKEAALAAHQELLEELRKEQA